MRKVLYKVFYKWNDNPVNKEVTAYESQLHYGVDPENHWYSIESFSALQEAVEKFPEIGRKISVSRLFTKNIPAVQLKEAYEEQNHWSHYFDPIVATTQGLRYSLSITTKVYKAKDFTYAELAKKLPADEFLQFVTDNLPEEFINCLQNQGLTK